ncbi:TRAF3-interacting JNK-activating modulator isoform X1 [Gopherus evgoodei]|uniref:TRAF3 interacting protein 3 n=2 Tax=Gopherus evgoodei TaxID=1825980 RepID=A0A8C4XXZ9_9SAUR|nr:TRAF3-interacting JNK-activating modulator isoform X1 [Gopherus evgoodei]XP_030417555.1 TRAF3-interacting JNK-activating modulator isoform X1 [Gopherus evgoodei]XP_030417556.1 TRAF3-interacting JNK-activating modulator isoform X1 [Gopherus evgoodei]XP_030417557.1 TRAF3-interacting JNK-activating modulator isoform X1 [Gopherus evgoodei]
MISQTETSPRRCKRLSESYDEKCERWQRTRESLWRRNNVTTCRHVRQCRKKEAEEQSQSPRQKEFLKRRNLATEEEKKQVRFLTGTPVSPRLECATGIPKEASSWMDLRSPTSLQNYRTSMVHHKHPQHSLNDSRMQNWHSCGISSQNILPKDISKLSQGTQTLTDSSAIKKNSSQQTDCGIAVLDKEIIQLSNYLKEALHRELLLKQKMVILQELLSTLLQASEKSWKGQLNEDKLKGKLRALENQLHTCAQNYSKDSVKRILMEMEDQKQTYEQKAREALQKLLEEKLQAEQQLQNTQRTLAVTEDDCALWKKHYDTLKTEWSETVTKHTELENKLHVLQNQLQWADTQNDQLYQTLRNLESEREDLYSRIEALQADNQLRMEHVSAMEGKLQNEQKQKLALEVTITRLHNQLQNQSKEKAAQEEVVVRKDQVLTMQIQPPSPVREKQDALLKHPDEEGEENLKDQVQKRTAQLIAKEKECADLRSELEALSDEYRSCMTKLRQCRDELNQFQSKQSKRQCGHWIPLLMVVIAAAMAAFLANFVP